jgi:chromosome segregation ATPase
MIDSARWGQLEKAVEQLLKRNLQLEERCAVLTAHAESWQAQRDDLLVEIESLLVELEQLRESAP